MSRKSIPITVLDEVTDEAAYWVGLLMADGNIYHNRVLLQLKIEDERHVRRFRDFVAPHLKVVYGESAPCSTGASGKYCRFEVTNIHLAETLRNYGVVERKSHSAEVIGLEHNSHFWRGVIDGDGCLYSRKVNGQWKLGINLCGSKPLLEQFRRFALTHCPDYRGQVNWAGSVWNIFIAGRNAGILLPILYPDGSLALERKAEKACLLMDRALTVKDRKTASREALTKFGPEQKSKALLLYQSGMKVAEVCQSLGMSEPTFYRALRASRKE